MSLFGPPDIEKLKEKKNVKRLCKILLKENDFKLRKEAARALGVLGDPKAVPALLSILRHEIHVRVGLSNPSAFMELTSQNNELRTIAAHALGKIGDEGAVRSLTGIRDDESLSMTDGGLLFGDSGTRLRRAAASALGQIRANRSKPELPFGWPDDLPDRQWTTLSEPEGGPGPGGDIFKRAVGHWNADRYDEAVQDYNEARKLGLSSEYEAAAWHKLGQISLKQEEVHVASAQFLQALYLNPIDASTAYGCAAHLALIYEELDMKKDLVAAVDAAKEALALINTIMSPSAAEEVRVVVRKIYT